MNRHLSFRFLTLVVGSFLLCTAMPAHAISFGNKDKIKVMNGAPFKDSNKFAIGAFRVTFITEDEVVSVGKGSWVTGGSSSSAAISGSLDGLDHATMQKIADQVYAEFLKQGTAKGLTFLDSQQLAQASARYKAMATTTNYEEGRLGTVVIPTGQQSVPLSEDHSEKANKGSKGMFAMYKNMGAADFATAEANKTFPEIAKELGVSVIGVTIVVNFADFKGGDGSFGHSKVSLALGATVEGSLKTELLRSTSIMGWSGKTATCPNCMGQMLLEGTVHSSEPIGTSDVSKSHKSLYGGLAGGPSTSTSKKGTVTYVDLPAYEKNVMAVATEATGMMIDELGAK
ncbi:MAG: hypothetical protein V4555_03915 [Acidobacteriota bacterium]